MAKKPVNKRVGRNEADLIDRGYMGDEPHASDIDTASALIRAYTWYNRFGTREDSIKWLGEFIDKHMPEYRYLIEKLDTISDSLTYGWTARIHANGKIDVEPIIKKHVMEIAGREAKVVILDEIAEVETVVKQPVDRIAEFLPDFEEALDNQDKHFNAYNYMVSRNVPQIYARRIVDYYQPVIEELVAARDKTDKQCVEAYRNLTKSEINIVVKLVTGWCDDIERFLDNTKKERAPRKPRVKSAEQKLKHFRYMQNHDKLKLVSANPAGLFKAKQAFILNTANNTLTQFVAKEGGLDVNRSSITNYDPDKSKAKKIGRSLTKTIEQVLTGNKKNRDNVLESVTTAYIPVIDRINNNSILLLIVK